MKLAIIGASRGIGLQLLKLALDEGHEVKAMVRNPSRFHLSHARLEIVRGDILDPSSVAATVSGQHAVCLCIGIPPTRQPTMLFSEGARRVLEAMGPASKAKLVSITGIGAGDSAGHGGFAYDRIFAPLFLRTIDEDKTRQEELLKASRANWMVVRPGFLTNGPRTGMYRVLDNLSGVKAGRISRADIADFILNQLALPTHFGKTPLVCY